MGVFCVEWWWSQTWDVGWVAADLEGNDAQVVVPKIWQKN